MEFPAPLNVFALARVLPDAVRLAYRKIVKPGVRFRQETITAIDPEARRVTTDSKTYDADVLVVAPGADYGDPARRVAILDDGSEMPLIDSEDRRRGVVREDR